MKGGADVAIDYQHEDPTAVALRETGGEDVDAVFDTVSGRSWPGASQLHSASDDSLPSSAPRATSRRYTSAIRRCTASSRHAGGGDSKRRRACWSAGRCGRSSPRCCHGRESAGHTSGSMPAMAAGRACSRCPA